MLSARLIHGLSVSMDCEETMIAKLKVPTVTLDFENTVILESAERVRLRVHVEAVSNVYGHWAEQGPLLEVSFSSYSSLLCLSNPSKISIPGLFLPISI